MLSLNVPLTIKEIRVERNVDPTLGSMLADEDKLVRALAADLENAIKYTPRQTTLSIEVRPATSDDTKRFPDRCRRYAEILISDEGPGIKATLGERVFDCFVQGPAPTDPGCLHGSGVGLNLVRLILSRLGGSAWLDSDEGSPARLGLSVPLA